MNKMIILCLISIVLLSACSKEDDAIATVNYTELVCSTTTQDSSFDGTDVIRINSVSEMLNTYEQLTVRGGSASLDYMVHTNANAKALLVLIAGGQLDAKITGIVGEQTSNASGNFLVRSAHLFAAQGYKVISIDRPSDWTDFIDPTHPNPTSGSAFDGYRLSSEHANDLQAIITAENTTSLPIVIAGTSRGAISAIAQHGLAEYLLLSAPVTSGGRGSPVGSNGVQPSIVGNTPVHMIWHEMDACFVSTPASANITAANFNDVTAVQVSGGINYPELSSRQSNKECDGSKTFHGFLGIEACVVKNATDWLESQLQIL